MLKQNIIGIRSRYLLAAIMVFVSVIALSLMNIVTATANAGQVQTRSIQMSKSDTGATAVNYTIKFNIATASTSPTLKGILVDICSGNTSPIVGEPCSQPTDFSWGGATPTVTSATVGATDISGWTKSAYNTNRTFTLSNATGITTSVNDVVTIVVSGITNPSDVDPVAADPQVGTFFGRIITFNDHTQLTSLEYSPTDGISTPAYIDYGGIALSTTQNLVVSAKVQEQLTFCVYITGTNCSNGSMLVAGVSGLNIKDSNGVINSGSVSTADAKFGLASNALGGVTVKMRGYDPVDPLGPAIPTLKSGAFTIDPFGAGNGVCTQDSDVSGTEQFGLRIADTVNITPTAPYACAAGFHGWDSTGNIGGDTVTSAYGDTIANTSGPQGEEQATLNFAAKSALTTEAGLYSIGLNFIATGTY